MEIITAFIAGVLAMIAAVLSWHLKSIDDAAARKHSLLAEKRAMLGPVYKEVSLVFQKGFMGIQDKKTGSSFEELLDVGARISLWAPDHIRSVFEETFAKFIAYGETSLKIEHEVEVASSNGGKRDVSELERAAIASAKNEFTVSLRALIKQMREDLEVNP